MRPTIGGDSDKNERKVRCGDSRGRSVHDTPASQRKKISQLNPIGKPIEREQTNNIKRLHTARGMGEHREKREDIKSGRRPFHGVFLRVMTDI